MAVGLWSNQGVKQAAEQHRASAAQPGANGAGSWLPQIQYVAVLADEKADASMLVTFDPKNNSLVLQRVGQPGRLGQIAATAGLAAARCTALFGRARGMTNCSS